MDATRDQPERSEFPAEGLAVSADVSFHVLAGRNVLFNEADQRLFEINDMAAYIWCAVAEGLGPEAILRELEGQGLARGTAKSYLETALQQWFRRGFVKRLTDTGLSFGPGGESRLQDIHVAGLSLRIRYATGLAAIVAPIFQHLEIQGTVPDTVLDVIESDGQIDLFRNGNWLFAVPPKEIATALKGRLLDEVLEGAAYELALHAAALARNGSMLLVSGHPGAGKTTLTLALVEAGFSFAGDDLALLNAQGCVTGVPFAPAVKTGAWNLVAAYRPDIWNVPVFRRPDRRRVRYPAPLHLAPASAYPVGWFVLLDRRPRAAATLTPVDPVSAVRWMLKESYARNRRLTTAGLNAVGRAVDRASYSRLTYSRLEDAVELLDQTCR